MTWSMRHHDGQEPGLDSNNGIFAIYDRMLHVRLEKNVKKHWRFQGHCFTCRWVPFSIYQPIASLNSLRLAKWNMVLILATVTSKKADVSSVSPSSERLEELWVVCGFICRKWSYAIGENIATRKQE